MGIWPAQLRERSVGPGRGEIGHGVKRIGVIRRERDRDRPGKTARAPAIVRLRTTRLEGGDQGERLIKGAAIAGAVPVPDCCPTLIVDAALAGVTASPARPLSTSASTTASLRPRHRRENDPERIGSSLPFARPVETTRCADPDERGSARRSPPPALRGGPRDWNRRSDRLDSMSRSSPEAVTPANRFPVSQ
jgi:hypothetical protein